MNKKFIIISLLIISFTSINFGSCDSYFIGIINAIGMSSGDYRYGENSTWLEYTIYVGANGSIMRSTGDNNIVFSVIPSPTTQQLNNVRVSPHDSFDDAVAVGNNGTVVYSFNAGNSWALSAPVTSSNLYGIDFIFGNTFAVGDAGTIMIAPYPGGAWTLQTSGTTRNLRAIKVSAQVSGTAIVVGEKGTILRTTNAGVNWINASLTDTTFNFNDISQKGIYFTIDINCAVGSNGRIYKTTNYGATWVQKTSGTTNNLRKVYFNSPDSGVVVGDNGTIRLTTNGGETWFQDAFFNSPSGRNYRSAGIINIDHGTYAALSDSLFIVSSDPLFVGVENINSAIPGEFSLSQNYPNPFNPSTKIKFQITKLSDTKLIVYDIQGRELEILINKTLTAGTYEADFDGSKYSSGVYFYKLAADEFVETKKMVLIK
ncbi:MAG: T9SS type A sorting domain-containing protein [Ignavibacteria bacterium]